MLCTMIYAKIVCRIHVWSNLVCSTIILRLRYGNFLLPPTVQFTKFNKSNKQTGTKEHNKSTGSGLICLTSFEGPKMLMPSTGCEILKSYVSSP